MGSYGKNGALWRPSWQLRGWCADGGQAFSESPRAQWRRQESWIASQLLQGFRCQICWEHPLCFPDIREVLLRGISVWTSLSFMNPLGKTKRIAIPQVFHMYKAFLDVSPILAKKKKKKSLFLTPQVTFQKHVPHFEWRGWEITFREFSYASCLQK